MWPHAVRHAAVARNRILTKVADDIRDVKYVENIMYGKWEKQPEARVTQQLEEITKHFDLSEPEDSEVTAPPASGTDEGSNEDIAADAEVKDPNGNEKAAELYKWRSHN
ncbi:hypothetical protein CLOP_g5092 [Closterium sp. NIES-67]|nr:hypothetical protein CLOP_g5092 [Closterium sp. NIES-67]